MPIPVLVRQEPKTCSEMLGEFLRELSVLVAVFFLFETLVRANPKQAVSAVHLVVYFDVSVMSLLFGLLIELRREG